MDYVVHGILQARVLEWVAVLFSRGLPNPGFEPRSPTLQADHLLSETLGKSQMVGILQEEVTEESGPYGDQICDHGIISITL